jgi:hypothetical protein
VADRRLTAAANCDALNVHYRLLGGIPIEPARKRLVKPCLHSASVHYCEKWSLLTPLLGLSKLVLLHMRMSLIKI